MTAALGYDTLATLLAWLALLVARMSLALGMLPLFATAAVPMTVRLTVVAGVCVCLLPLVAPDVAQARIGWPMLWLLLLKEAGLGAVLGLLASLAFWALYAAGSIVEQQAGLAMNTTIDPLSGQEGSLLGAFFVQVFGVVFLVSGGLLSLLGLLFESYRVWPIEQLVPAISAATALATLADLAGGVLDLAMRVALPFVFLMLLTELGLGLLGRLTPQFNTFFLAMPLKAALLLGLLLLYSTALADASDVAKALDALRRFVAIRPG